MAILKEVKENAKYKPLTGENSVIARAFDWPEGHEEPIHFHDFGQLIYASHGVLKVTSKSQVWVIPPQLSVWIPPGIPHSIFSKTKAHFRTIYITASRCDVIQHGCHIAAVSILLRELILEAIHISEPYVQESREGRIMNLIVDEISNAKKITQGFHLPLPKDKRVLPIVELLMEDSEEILSLSDCAQKVGASGRTIQRLFLSETGLSFAHWRRQAILLRALIKLSEGEAILNVALDLGYKSPSAFTYMFRQVFGVTPSQFFKTAL